jgi:hypothetical protein
MLEEHRWGLAIPVSQIACEGPSKTHLAWGAWGVPVEKLLCCKFDQPPNNVKLGTHGRKVEVVTGVWVIAR